MLKSIGIKNFRTFKELDNFEIDPLTVLCGTNSSGKSTLIKSLLLCKQTLERSYKSQRGFSYNGELVKLGPPQNWPFNNEQNKEIQFKFCVRVSKEPRNSRLDNYLFRTVTKILRRTQRIEAEYELIFKLGFRSNPREDGGINITDYHLIINIINKVKVKHDDLEGLPSKEKRRKLLEIRINGNPNDNYTVSWKNLPPVSIPVAARARMTNEMRFEELAERRKKGSMTDMGYPPFYSFIALARPRNIESELKYEEDYTILQDISRISWDVETVIENALDSYHYLGPIRAEPRKRFFDEGQFSGSIGTKGENAPFVLAHYIKQKVKFYHLDSNNNKFNLRTTTLRIAADYWLNELGIHNFKLKKYESDILSIHLDSSEYSGHNVSIADVGFGVSQVVPIIIEGLLVEAGSTLIVEQPELHLHPKMQMKLADFFISLVLAGKKIIIETHSEHIINRLVRRVVEDTEDKFNHLVGINFVTNTKNGSKIEKVELSETDGIINWPDEFFDQAADEIQKTMTAIINKRK